MAGMSPTWSFEPMIVAEVWMTLGVRPLQAAKVRVILAATLVQVDETKVSEGLPAQRKARGESPGAGGLQGSFVEEHAIEVG
jgi:hypothetical protein